MKQTIVWTALPNGIMPASGRAGKRLRLSVAVAPRLESDPGSPVLKGFDFVNWPQVEVDFLVKFDGGPEVPAVRVVPLPEPELWAALFKESTYVKPFELPRFAKPDLAGKLKIHSYPVKSISQYIKTKFTEIAANPATATSVPKYDLIKNQFKELAGFKEKAQVIQKHLDSVISMKGAVPANSASLIFGTALAPKAADAVNLASGVTQQEADFMQARRFYSRVFDTVPVQPRLDFHQVLAMIHQYPEIARRLGLVINLEVPLGSNVPASSRVRVIPVRKSKPMVSAVDVCPWTKYTLNANSLLFITASRPANPELAGGRLIVSKPGAPEHEDPCHLEQVDVGAAAVKVVNMMENQGLEGMPAVRNAGVSLVRKGLAERLKKKLQELAGLDEKIRQNQEETTLYAEDVVRGYRVDVWDNKTNKWHSLCRRTGRYHFQDGGITREYTDEGYVQMGVTHAQEDSEDLYLHESLLSWDGWSLCVPRPGKAIKPDDVVAEARDVAGSDFRLETSFSVVKGSLPRLRFGTTYRLRVRAVDLAGNSVPFVENDTNFSVSTVTRPLTYTRFDPVPPPAVVLQKPSGEGESLERVVVRSNFDTPPSSIQPAGRHIVPPETAQVMAETHGKFDSAAGLNKASYDIIKSREGSLNRDQEARQAPHPEAQMKVPYLPDPMAAGVALTGIPGSLSSQVIKIPFPKGINNWLGVAPFRIDIVGTEALSVGGQNRLNALKMPKLEKDAAGAWVLRISLPKAEVARLKVSSYFDSGIVVQSGVWQWINQARPSQEKMKTLSIHVLNGNHHMITPSRELTIVHAVRQPLLQPDFKGLTVTRPLGGAYALLWDEMSIHGKSTGKLEIWADWKEPVDNVLKPEWETLSCRSHVFETPVKKDQIKVLNPPKVYLNKQWQSQRHEFGDTKYRRVTYQAVASSRFGEYFPAGSNISREGNKVTVDVLNSARPDAPGILYMVPTFGWEKSKTDTRVNSKRNGGGLRVYMERPWFSSGEGEMLGVVLRQGPEPAGNAADPLRPYVTQWGNDPLWLSGNTYDVPSAYNFKAFKKVSKPPNIMFIPLTNIKENLTISEVADARVTVVGHPVKFDRERGLWYSDLVIDSGPAYYPFVRLALARYQPKSVDNAHISKIIQADFVQLTPERSATVINSGSSRVKVTVTGITPSQAILAQSFTLKSRVQVSVEIRAGSSNGDLSWLPAQGHSVMLTRNQGAGSWEGFVSLPKPWGSQNQRLVIKEFEVYFSGNSTADGTPEKVERLVYADVLYI